MNFFTLAHGSTKWAACAASKNTECADSFCISLRAAHDKKSELLKISADTCPARAKGKKYYWLIATYLLSGKPVLTASDNDIFHAVQNHCSACRKPGIVS